MNQVGDRYPEERSSMDKEKKEKEEGRSERLEVPPINDLRMELAREEARYEFRKALLNIAGILAVVAAIAALVMTRVLILLQVNGNSMAPALEDAEIVILHQTKEVEPGDIIGFYYGGKILLKRVVGRAGDEIDMDEDGNIYVNGVILDEPYVSEKKQGKYDQEFPYRVPENMVFVLGDNRAVSLDSRVKSIGCVEDGQIVGKAVFRAWPFGRIGRLRY